MGVHGLWRLIEPSGKPVPLETLENKVLAIDVSIWLHQAIKGFQDSKGAPLPNAHLLGIYHRVCKLLYFRIKPVFVFDGGVPALKTQTIAKRNQLKSKHLSEADNIQKQLLSTLLKHSAINKVLSESTKASLPKPKPSSSKHVDDLYVLPPSQLDSTISSSEEEEFSSSFTTSDSSPTKHWDLYGIDVKSAQFKSLPPDIRHEILTELKDTRKQNSWGRLHELPTQTDEFSGYQMDRLLKRYSVQNAMEEAEKEMGGHSLSLGELEALLNDHGVITDEMGKRLASDENTRFLYIKDVKKALEKAKLEESLKKDKVEEIPEENQVKDNLDSDREFQRDLEKAIVLSLQSEASTSKNSQGSSADAGEKILGTTASQAFLAARNYMMEYTGLTPKGIEEIFAGKANISEEKKEPKIALEDILEETEKILKDNQVCNKNVEESKNDSKGFEGSELPNNQIVKEDHQSVKIDNKVRSSIENKLSNENPDVKSDSIISINDTLDLSNENSVVKYGCQGKGFEGSELPNDQIVEEDHQNVKIDNKIESSIENKLSNVNPDVKSDSIISINDTLDLSNESVDDLSKNVTKKVTFATPGEVGIMSDSSDSEGFVEVSDSEKEGNKMEIVINPNAQLEDDLFGDIFDEKEETQVENVSDEDKLKSIGLSKPNLTKLKDLINSDAVEEVSIVDEKAIVNEDVEKTSKEEVKIVSKEEVKMVSKEEEKVEVKKISKEELKQMGSQLETETRELISERSNKERLAGNITDQMYQEAQELLRLFGVPYIIAPMEAEAQCAFLNEINLTDGTITDDSDIWLFGGKIVYKNFFNQSKHVMEYRSENIEHHFKLSRNQLILLALLVGSDYTMGIHGVGPVTALEILAAFPPGNQETLSYAHLISGLTEFRNWFTNGKIAGPGRATLRTKLKNLEFTGNFPNLSVIKAYLEPRVETSREKFSWGKPDPVALIDYAKKKFGWTRKKSEEILNPVMQRLQETKAQTSIRDYFKTKHKLTPTDLTDKMSKRVKKAISKIAKEKVDLSSDEEEKPKKNSRKKTDGSSVGDGEVIKKTRKNAKAKRNVKNDAVSKKKLETPNEDININLSSDEDVKVLMGTKKVSKKKIEEDVEKELTVKSVATKRAKFVRESIPQKTRDKCELMRNKLKAIEVFRKSKQGPGFVKRRERVARKPKDDAELSESSDSE